MKNKQFTSIEFIGGLPHGGNVSLGKLENRSSNGWVATPGDTFGDPWDVLASIGDALAKTETTSPLPKIVSLFTVAIKMGKLSAIFEITADDTTVRKLLATKGLSAEDEQMFRQFLLEIPGIIASVVGTEKQALSPQGMKTEGVCSCCMQWKEIDVFTRQCSSCSASGRCG